MIAPLQLLDLFSGIGGFSLGLERAGMKTVAFCEIDPFCRRVLAKHWPDVRQYEDVRTLTAERLRADGISVDVICGGFPCQDISYAGNGEGLAGKRSGLWSEISRLVGELRPTVCIVENVTALLSRGMGTVCGDLAALGYDAEWHCIPASAVGAHHRRDRLWIIAHSDGFATRGLSERKEKEKPLALIDGEALANANGFRQQGSRRPFDAGYSEADGDRKINRAFDDRGWPTEPNVGRMAYGVPNGMDRLKALGNAVVPQIPELIGRAILERIAA